MLIPFTDRSRLVSALNALALYNDKGIAWRKHTNDQRKLEREKALKKIGALTSKIGETALPPPFLEALKTGEVGTDLTGQYAELVKRHFEHVSAL